MPLTRQKQVPQQVPEQPVTQGVVVVSQNINVFDVMQCSVSGELQSDLQGNCRIAPSLTDDNSSVQRSVKRVLNTNADDDKIRNTEGPNKKLVDGDVQ